MSQPEPHVTTTGTLHPVVRGSLNQLCVYTLNKGVRHFVASSRSKMHCYTTMGLF